MSFADTTTGALELPNESSSAIESATRSVEASCDGVTYSPLQSRIMIVDDEPINIKVVRRYLKDFGYQNFSTSTDPTKVMSMIEQEKPDVILLDIIMPEISGLELLDTIRHDKSKQHIPVLILTAASDAETQLQALELGATDFLAKPVNQNELAPRIRNALIVKAHRDHLAQHAQHLEEQVQIRTAELESSRREVIFCLARAAEYRDNDTGHHIIRVGRYAGIIARELGLGEEHSDTIELAAQLHDLGKIGIPDDILKKPGKLDPEEFGFLQKHCTFGRKIIQEMPDSEWKVLRQHVNLGAEMLDVQTSPIMTMASRIAQTHHEKWDGTGYPLGLAAEDIPIEGRITAVADVFDALSSRRPYKEPFPSERCFEMMLEKRGTHFDPDALDAFLRRRNQVVRVQIDFADFA